ncbi:HAD-IIIA family hydrolase [Paenibacillus sp. 1001270B_150601_E10]|uniref:HAD-IIIA family hydrolase n=1 Tax=Paenibacillus sp. 1001270B_150601_E10 TaxID=2787079 RepID=UPI00189FEAA2|nr:HAD-IIIA family hydrolase [Paenibacillus sp. 1001270B_150601_E10]
MARDKAVFIDRDGTIGGDGHFIHPDVFTCYDGALASIQRLKDAGYYVFALTNQHRISKGQATMEEFERQFATFGFDQAYICPHGMSEPCECRKPNPGMLLKAVEEHQLDLSACFVIGDVGDTDMLAAHRAGMRKILVLTGWGKNSFTQYRDQWFETEPDYVAEDINEAVGWLLSQSSSVHIEGQKV